MTSQFQNYVPIQGLIGAVAGILTAEESISESPEIITPTSNTENISESPVVTIT